MLCIYNFQYLGLRYVSFLSIQEVLHNSVMHSGQRRLINEIFQTQWLLSKLTQKKTAGRFILKEFIRRDN